MGNYDLQRLGGVGFQSVVAALAIKALGANVRPMGRGRDGGRDMIVSDGRIVWTSDADSEHAEVWNGTTVFQVKHKETLEGPDKNPQTVWQAIKKELDAWANPDPSSGRGRMPDYIVFATNVPLTPTPGSGGYDKVCARIRAYLDALSDETAENRLEKSRQQSAREKRHKQRDRMASLQKWKLWDGNYIEGLLDAHEGVRRAFDALLTPGDVLADLSALTTNVTSAEIVPALREHARTRLVADRKVYFDEAGGEPKGVSVEEVVIDLPVLVGGDQPERERVMGYVMDRGERVLAPGLTTLSKPRHIVLTGAPGNGKSTVAKFLTHAYRATFLAEDVALGEEQSLAVARTRSALRSMDVRVPAHRRWPVNIDLAQFAAHQAGNADYSLIRWIATKVSEQSSSKEIPRWALRSWLRSWPSFIVLDGLDEVAEPLVRQALIAEIEAFVSDAEADDWDTLVVVTTRPMGYQNELPAALFERIDLSDLTVEDALMYGRRVTKVRIPDDTDRRDGVISRLELAAKDESLSRLLRTPLQTLIMSIITETSPHLTPGRYSLFWKYFRTIYQREQQKSAYGKLLRDHFQSIFHLHLRVGLQLQEQAETATGAEAVLSQRQIRDAAWQVLNAAEYDPSGSDGPLLNQLIAAATQRLVLLVPRYGGYGFDVRSLQELMAACALTTGELSQTIPRLRQVSASPHWRNTFLFAAGRYFDAPQPHEKEAVVQLVLSLDKSAPERLGETFPIGPFLAIEMVDDGMISEPRYLNPLVTHAMDILREPIEQGHIGYAQVLMTAASERESVRRIVEGALRDALSGPPTERGNARAVQHAIREISRVFSRYPEVTALAKLQRDPAQRVEADPIADWAGFWAVLSEYSEPASEGTVRDIGQRLQAVSSAGLRIEDRDALVEAFADPDVAFIIDLALRHVADASPLLVSALRHSVLPQLWRRPVRFDNGLSL